jgi:DNA primase
MISAELLRRLRNDLPMAVTIAALGRVGPPAKIRDGRYCFLCPRCNEILAYVNPRNNLAHCFHCGTNLNNIDLLRTMGFDFPSAVEMLERWLIEYERRRPKSPSADRK